ncbi:hypothetical protein EXS57_00500 [Candidatus Kaiserbacteria bacterium]|nr:hypothetical protein [Candidatus Kaiserbacteria bacterium]
MAPMKTLAPSVASVKTSGPKGQKFISIVDAAYNKAGLSDDEAQNVNDTAGLSALVNKFIADSRSPKLYADEEASSRYKYLSGYTKPKDVIWQSNQLRVLFSGVGFHDEKAAQMAVPEGAEGLFVIPTWQSFAKLHSVSTYAEAVQIVLAKLNETRKGKFYNHRENEMGSDNLRESARKAEVMEQIAQSQKGYDLLVIPGQFGIVHRGRSVRRARVVIGSKDFVLGALEVGIMLLTHPERLQHYDDLYIDCAGDEFKPGDRLDFSCAPIFRFRGDKLWFDAYEVEFASGYYGSASGFLPPQ